MEEMGAESGALCRRFLLPLGSSSASPLERQNLSNLELWSGEPVWDSCAPPLSLPLDFSVQKRSHGRHLYYGHSPSPGQDGLSLIAFPGFLQKNTSPNLDRRSGTRCSAQNRYDFQN